jgi:hypothetical protein
MQDPKKTVDELDKEMAVERFLKGFLDDLNRVRESQNSSTSDEALPIADVVGRSEQLEDFVKHLQNKYGVLLDQYTETVVEKYKSSN